MSVNNWTRLYYSHLLVPILRCVSRGPHSENNHPLVQPVEKGLGRNSPPITAVPPSHLQPAGAAVGYFHVTKKSRRCLCQRYCLPPSPLGRTKSRNNVWAQGHYSLYGGTLVGHSSPKGLNHPEECKGFSATAGLRPDILSISRYSANTRRCPFRLNDVLGAGQTDSRNCCRIAIIYLLIRPE